MNKMKQAVLAGPGSIEIKEVPVPEPSAGEVVVKVKTALTCGTDLKAYMRGHELIPMPGPFGHEFSGTVAKTGEKAGTFKEGDDVMGVHSGPCLRCGYCGKGLYNLCENIMKNKVLGAFSGYLLLPSHVVSQNLFLKPGNVSFEEAALLEPLSCVVHPYNRLDIDMIDTALVIGAGPIGLMHLACLKKEGVHVTVLETSEDRRTVAGIMGADNATAVYMPGSFPGAFNGVDLVIECTGRKEVWEQSINYVRRGGSVVLFGGCPSGTKAVFDSHRIHYDELTVSGSFHFTPADVSTARNMITGHELDLSKLITGRFPLDETARAFSLLKEGKGIKYALIP